MGTQRIQCAIQWSIHQRYKVIHRTIRTISSDLSEIYKTDRDCCVIYATLWFLYNSIGYLTVRRSFGSGHLARWKRRKSPSDWKKKNTTDQKSEKKYLQKNAIKSQQSKNKILYNVCLWWLKIQSVQLVKVVNQTQWRKSGVSYVLYARCNPASVRGSKMQMKR